MEAERREIGDRAHAPAAVLGAEGMRRVLDEAQAALARERAEPVEVGRLAGIVHGDEGARARRHPLRDIRGIDVQRVGAHVGEDRRAAVIEHARWRMPRR